MPDQFDGAPPADDAPVEVPEPPTEIPPDLPDVPPPGPENLVTEADERIDAPAYPLPGPVIYVSDEHHGTGPEPSDAWHFDEDV